MFLAKKLVLAHFWVAFIAFLGALVLGAWQMYVRSPLSPWVNNPEHYYRSVTAHGTVMAYVLPTLVAMGFGYAITELALKKPLIGVRWAWGGFWLVIAGTAVAAVTMGLGKASVLYTFYPPMLASSFYYIGVVLVVVGSWIWVALMSVNLHAWKKENPGAPVPLAMFGNVAGAYLWAWTSVGAAVEVLVLILPASLGLTDTINAGLARVLFSWTLHAIVYFWLMPAYIVFYTIVPRAIGGRLYSDTMGRIAFVLFLVFSMPIGIHHLFADPQVGAGFKFVHAAMTAMVSVPTLLTVFTIVASVEIAGRLRGGTGLFGWVKALPWDNPMMLAVTFSFIMLGFGGAGGIINMSYQLNETIHNTQWVTGHFHLIFAGAIVLMYFMAAYELWPQLTGCAPLSRALIKAQIWLWFIGMMVLSMPWHLVGLLGMPRRMAYYDFTHPDLQSQAWTVTASAIGGFILLASGILLVYILATATQAAQRGGRAVHLQPGGASRRPHSGRFEWLRPLGGDDDWPDTRQLWLPHCPTRLPQGRVRPRHSRGEPVMREEGMYSWGNPWFRWSVVSLAALTVVSVLVGFVWLPSVHGDFSAQGLWASICRAAGVPMTWSDGAASAKSVPQATHVVLERSMTRVGGSASVGRGATLALNCTMCHGGQGMSTSNCAEPGRPVPGGRHQATRGLQGGQARQPHHGGHRKEPGRARHR